MDYIGIMLIRFLCR